MGCEQGTGRVDPVAWAEAIPQDNKMTPQRR